MASRSPRSIATADGVRPLSSVASTSAPSSISSFTWRNPVRRPEPRPSGGANAACTGVCPLSKRERRRDRQSGFSSTSRLTRCDRPAPWPKRCGGARRARAADRSTASLPLRAAQPITSPLCTSPVPCTSAPASSSSADALEIAVRGSEVQRRSRCRRRSRAFGSAPCSINRRTASGMANGQVQPGRAAGEALASEPGSFCNSSRNASTSPVVHARKNAAIFGARRRSISAFSARQLGKPYSRAIASCASASRRRFGRAQQRRSRSFASFFRYRATRVRGD